MRFPVWFRTPPYFPDADPRKQAVVKNFLTDHEYLQVEFDTAGHRPQVVLPAEPQGEATRGRYRESLGLPTTVDEVDWATFHSQVVAQVAALYRMGELDWDGFMRVSLVMLVKQNERLMKMLTKQYMETTDAPGSRVDADQGRDDNQVRVHPPGGRGEEGELQGGPAQQQAPAADVEGDGR
jgi:hypothetical protein